MIKEELTELRLVKNEPCVSIIVPANSIPPEREQYPVEVDNAIRRASHILLGKYGEEKVMYLLNKLKRVTAAIDYVNESGGLGIFLSKDVSKVMRFPFPVKEKVFVGDEFEIKDLLYTAKNLFVYYFLLISKKRTRLFKGYGDMINEVIDENYPKEFVDDYEDESEYKYEKDHMASSAGNSLKGEVEKTIIEERRFRAFLQNIDYLMFLYLKKDAPFFVAGDKQHLDYYKHITNHTRNIAGFVEGNFERQSIDEIRATIILKTRNITKTLQNSKL
jgi:Bacterial archaeo-eukaryotic release factor family 3